MVSIGRTGQATPFAMLEPVFVGGSTVGVATLHNQDQVKVKDVRPGDIVIVRKAGDVIPEVVGPVLSERPKKGLKAWEFPTNCPVCGDRVRSGSKARPTALRQPAVPGPCGWLPSTTSPPAARWTSKASANARFGSVP